MCHWTILFITVAASLALTTPHLSAATPEEMRSPENQVFQFAHTASCSEWSDGSTSTATAYLWIPEESARLRGLLILCTNVPEHMLVGHAEIRRAAAANDLGIVWSVPTFMNFRKGMPQEHKTIMLFLQQLLNGLAEASGYEEVASVPWLPMGESGHLLMVDALVESAPDRCVAGVWIKNNHLPPSNRTVPALVAFGTAQEWSQDQSDIRTKWNDVASIYQGILERSREHPEWPLSYIMDGTSGHFDCSERLAAYFARYIDAAAKARIAEDGTLRPVRHRSGVVAGLPVAGSDRAETSVYPADGTRALPWYFDSSLASEAQAIANINWAAQTQFIGFVGANDATLPYDFGGITNLKTLDFEEDGITFTVRARLLEQVPAGFVGAGEPLAKTPGEPVVEWVSGPIRPLGAGRFQIALDRTWGPGAVYLAARQPGAQDVRAIVQPAGVSLKNMRNLQGLPQKITFTPIGDVVAGAQAITLHATSDAGLPVRFYVVSGPAVVEGNTLRFTRLPPRTRYPVPVTVAAWQWGRSVNPLVKTAETRQTFNITDPAAPRPADVRSMRP